MCVAYVCVHTHHKADDSLSHVHSKWFLNDIGHDGLNNLLAAYADKGAKAVCTFGFSQGPGYEPMLFQGITEVSSQSVVGPP